MTIYETNTLRCTAQADTILRETSIAYQWLRDGAPITGVPLAITGNPAPVTVTEPAPASFAASAVGYTTRLWQSSPNNTTWTNIVGATGATFTIPGTDHTIHDGTYYRMSATNGITTVYTASALLTVNEGSGITLVDGDEPAGFTVPMDEIWEIDGDVTVSASVEVHGTLRMRPGSSLTFENVDEEGMIGTKPAGQTSGTPATDVGLWIHEMGTLDAHGTPKTAWTRLAGAAVSGATTITLTAAPTNWQVGDQIVIAPTEALTIPGGLNDVQVNNLIVPNFLPEERRIKAITGAVVTLGSDADQTIAAPLTKNHPTYTFYDGAVYTAEVLNLTRDVKIQGTTAGRSHVMFHSQSPINVSYVELDLMGPATATKKILGRWSFHMHLLGYYTVGTVIEGVVVHRSRTHCFVPHGSHGVRLQDCIAYDARESPYWWDSPGGGLIPIDDQSWEQVQGAPDRTGMTVWDRCVAAKCNPVFKGTINGFAMLEGLTKYPQDGSYPHNGDAHPFPIPNVITNSVAFSIGGSKFFGLLSAGFKWANIGFGGTWNIHDCVSHHNRVAMDWWTNLPKNEVSTGFRAYLNAAQGRQGAYVTDASWEDSFFESVALQPPFADNSYSVPMAVSGYSRSGVGRLNQRCVFVASAGFSAFVVGHHAIPDPELGTVRWVDSVFKPGAGAIAAISIGELDENNHAIAFIRPVFVLPAGVPKFWWYDQHAGGELTTSGLLVQSDVPLLDSYVDYDDGTNIVRLHPGAHPDGVANGWTFNAAWNAYVEDL